MRRILTVASLVLLCATARAQTKVSGTAQRGKPDPQHIIALGDRPQHSLGVEQFRCTWTKPMEIGGDKSKDGVSTATANLSGNTSRARGFHVTTIESGNVFFVWY